MTEEGTDTEVQSLSRILEQERQREQILSHRTPEAGSSAQPQGQRPDGLVDRTLSSRVALASSILEPSSDAEQVSSDTFLWQASESTVSEVSDKVALHEKLTVRVTVLSYQAIVDMPGLSPASCSTAIEHDQHRARLDKVSLAMGLRPMHRAADLQQSSSHSGAQ